MLLKIVWMCVVLRRKTALGKRVEFARQGKAKQDHVQSTMIEGLLLRVPSIYSRREGLGRKESTSSGIGMDEVFLSMNKD